MHKQKESILSDMQITLPVTQLLFFDVSHRKVTMNIFRGFLRERFCEENNVFCYMSSIRIKDALTSSCLCVECEELSLLLTHSTYIKQNCNNCPLGLTAFSLLCISATTVILPRANSKWNHCFWEWHLLFTTSCLSLCCLLISGWILFFIFAFNFINTLSHFSDLVLLAATKSSRGFVPATTWGKASWVHYYCIWSKSLQRQIPLHLGQMAVAAVSLTFLLQQTTVMWE